MIPKPVKKLLVEILEKTGGGKDKREAKAHPEKCLTALLLNINRDVADASSMLKMTVRYSTTEDTLIEADRLLRRWKSRKANGKRKKTFTTLP